jgi:hypothetical protein
MTKGVPEVLEQGAVNSTLPVPALEVPFNFGSLSVASMSGNVVLGNILLFEKTSSKSGMSVP